MRRAEYGTAGVPDYMGQGQLAERYTQFIIQELLPYLQQRYPTFPLTRRAFAGWSLGGLSALDIVWRYPSFFQLAGIFSGSLWWRSKPLGADYRDDRDRIMHQLIRVGNFHPGQQFFFECGTADETADRNMTLLPGKRPWLNFYNFSSSFRNQVVGHRCADVKTMLG
ncbi:alpha/beta hydrolase [Chitinophaga sp. 30R24]|uniref:alpha/beta hydrolase n=1 Tax=Chitinophaga sp. 30R24 TaxID=3248838 RepID=UPI003B8FE689